MFVYRYLVLSHVYAAATSAPSAVQTCSTLSAPFPYNHDPCLWDENTQLHAYSNPQCLSIFHLQTCRTTADRYGRTSNWERYLEGQWIRNERGLAVGWVVWRRSYLSRNANAASSGPGPSESVVGVSGVTGGERGWRTRRIAEFLVIHDGNLKDPSFCRSCRFVCSFIAHLPPFLPTSIILVQSFFLYLLTSVFLRLLLSLLRIFPHSPTFYSATIQLLKLTLSSFAFAVITDEQRFMSLLPVLALLDPTTIFSAVQSTTFPSSYLLNANSKSRSTIHIR